MPKILNKSSIFNVAPGLEINHLSGLWSMNQRMAGGGKPPMSVQASSSSRSGAAAMWRREAVTTAPLTLTRGELGGSEVTRVNWRREI